MQISKKQMLIYALKDPRTDVVHYVGQTTRGASRRNEVNKVSYLGDRKDHAVKAWVNGLRGDGLRPVFSALEFLNSKDELDAAERGWIRYGRSQGWPLLNLTDGGKGQLGRKISDETRQKLRDAIERRGPEVMEKMWAANRGTHHTDEHKAKIGAALKGKPLAEETKKKISIANSKPRGPMSQERRDAISRGSKGKKKSPEHAAAISAGRLQKFKLLKEPTQCLI